MDKRYHHGDLPAALRTAAAELVAERGSTGFSLREVARRAGVSHAAPAHHFGGSRGLLNAVATEGFERLVLAFENAVDGVDDAQERLGAMGKAYIRTAMDNPGHFEVMIHEDLSDMIDDSQLGCRLAAYMLLLDAVGLVRDQLNPNLDVESAATLCWASMQGLVELAPRLEHVAEMTGTTVTPLEVLVEQFVAFMLDGFKARTPS